MKPQFLSLLKMASLLFGAIVATVFMLIVQGTTFDTALLYLLLIGVAPYFVFLVITWLLERFTRLPAIHMIGFIIADLMLIFTIAIYALTWDDQASPYYGFLFLVVPVYLFVGSIALLMLSSLVSWFISRRK